MTFQIIDNFLPADDFKKLQEIMLSSWFPWYKIDFKLNKDSRLDQSLEKYNLQFIHTFYKEHRSWSEFMTNIAPLVGKIDPLSIIRIKANLTTATEYLVKYDLHNDFYDDRITTAIYYLNTNNGYTHFEDGSIVDSVENRLVKFNSTKLHSGTTCTDKKFRCVLNLNFIK